MVGVINDISFENESRNHLSDYIDCMIGALDVVDRGGKIVRHNAAAAAFYGINGKFGDGIYLDLDCNLVNDNDEALKGGKWDGVTGPRVAEKTIRDSYGFAHRIKAYIGSVNIPMSDQSGVMILFRELRTVE